MTARSQHYLGKEYLKKAGIRHNYTREEFQEYVKCANDCRYFIETYCKVVHPEKGLIPFILREYQVEALEKLIKHRFNLLNWSRQSGKSELIGSFLLWNSIFLSNKRMLITSYKKEAAMDVLKRIKTSFTNLPKFLSPGIARWNEGDVEFENGSSIITDATTKDSGRGKPIFIGFVDEVAFVQNFSEFWDAVYPTISSGENTKMIMSSTPRGMSNAWYKLVTDARQNKNEFQLTEAPWWRVPGRDQKWKEKQIKNSSEELFRQNFELEFHGSSGTLITGKKLKELTSISPIDFNIETNFRTYVKPIPKHTYVITVDTSRGSGIDSSAFSVIDVTTQPFQQVAAFSNPDIFSHEFAELIYQTAKKYNDAYLLIENNDLGQEVANIIFNDYEYDSNIFFAVPMGREGVVLTLSPNGNLKLLPGIKTTKRTKRLGCSNFKNILEGDQLVLSDEETINEVCNFIRVKDSYEADEGSHDDLVMGLVLFGYLVDQKVFKEITQSDFSKNRRFRAENDESMIPDFSKILGGEHYIDRSMMQEGFFTPVQRETDDYYLQGFGSGDTKNFINW